ncbi:MAG: glycine/sarcosine/betaine reductase component B subunit [Chloroflexota bacterium]|nr:glycine/sarcosine/betaine reductase component B subunit [Chloroflexota bacterium]
MKLELITYPVKNVEFGRLTSYKNGILKVDKEELKKLVLEDERIVSVDLDVAFPGEQTRIVNVRDMVEPRVKVSGPGGVFPGIIAPVQTVGEGRTHRLSGVTVTASAKMTPTIMSGTAAQDTAILDMWGPGAQLAPLSSLINIVLVLRLADTVSELDTHAAIITAECKVAKRLAETTVEIPPQNMEVFELHEVSPSLPRVVYIVGFMTNWHAPHSAVAYYGLPVRESLPTFVHPNEFLDGALTADARKGISSYARTWQWMNNPVVFKLLREHGKRLNFLGVIVQRTRFEAEHGKLVSAAAASQMARLLGADGAFITRTTASGANFVDVMLTVQACEQKGIKTVLLGPEWGGKDGSELPLVFYVPEATAMVSTGSTDRETKMPAPSKVIGMAEDKLVQLVLGNAPFSPWSEITLDDYSIAGASDWWGENYFTRKAY